ncbi:helix-turn-helix transcriptional regulator [Kribbella caucasensis]|uniref:helix-turn-helix transcriptional regulator n=1 Tax=Kribbella caucasensis TaxID=2512215 RepID=UPI001414CF7B|nr:LuxR family transcriptional regulator [Kribbella sp. VKM Ac-2527]
MPGRDAERARIDRLLASARAGSGGGLLVLGEPGIGKTALLDDTAARADSFRVLRATGVELETELAYSGLFELLRPVAAGVADLPPRQEAALRTAFAETPVRELDGFAVAAAVLTLLSEAAAVRPVLCLIDDTQWIDAASVAALAFTVRRVESERVAMVFAAREQDGTSDLPRGIPALPLPGLDGAAAREVLTAQAGQELPGPVASALLRAGGGNPLALRELVGSVGPEELRGRAPLAEPLPVGGEIAGIYRRKLAALPATTRAALLVLAVSERAGPEQLLPAITALTGDPSALDPAERDGLVRTTPSALTFRHPVLRSVVHQEATLSERKSAHRCVAANLPAGQAEMRAWHAALAAPGPDETVAAELARTADLARARGGRWAESRAFELAARLSTDAEPRAERTYLAAVAAFRAGRHSIAEQYLEAVLALTTDPLLRADAEHERARISLWRGRPEPPERLQRAADRVAAYDVERAAKLLAYPVVGLGASCRPAAALPYARRAWELIGRRAQPLVVSFKVAYILVMAGETVDGAQLTAAATEVAEGTDDVTALAMLGPVLGWLDRSADAERVLSRAVELCRADGDLWMLTNALTNAAEASRRAGRLDQALVQADEARALAEQLDEPVQLATAVAGLARVEADLGRGIDCRAHAEQVRRADPQPAAELEVTCAAALGTLALASGRYQDAVDELAPAVDSLADGGVTEPRTFAVEGDLAEALARCGQVEEAMRLVERLEAYGRPRKAASVLAVAARCRGLLASDGEFEACFGDALAAYGSVDAPLEQARTLLCLGERLRRQGRRSAARDHLRTAWTMFEQRGAAYWADRARSELRLTGETLQRRTDDPRRQLTPQELQIALLVADGARNTDVAISLFVSPKTVEAHLTRVYRKLGVASRTQLAAQLAHAAQRQA